MKTRQAIIEEIAGSTQLRVIENGQHTSIPLSYFMAASDMKDALEVAIRYLDERDGERIRPNPVRELMKAALDKAGRCPTCNDEPHPHGGPECPDCGMA